MKKFLSLLVAAVLVTTLVMPVTASATYASYKAKLVITDGITVTSVPSGWVDFTGDGTEYRTTDFHPATDLASTHFNQWTADNFLLPDDDVFVGFADDLEGKTLAEIQKTSTKFNVIKQIDVTVPKIEEGQDVLTHPFSFTSTPEGASTGYDFDWYKVPAGTEFVKAAAEKVNEGETFDKAYDYYLDLLFESGEEYMFTAKTTCFANGTEVWCEYDEEDMELITNFKVDFKSDEPTTEAPTETTAAPTTTAATTAASTATKTGDTMNPMFYVITIIALVAAATVSIFAARKKK